MGVTENLGPVQLIGIAASFSLLAGWRLYATLAVAGLAMRLGFLHLPQQIHALSVLTNPMVIGISIFGAAAELLADKVMWLDSLWDSLHFAVRPIGGGILALAILDQSDPATAVVIFLLGGGAALLSHSAKAGARAAINVSPEPLSNVAVSATEDVVALGGLVISLISPAAAFAVATTILIVVVGLAVVAWRIAGSLKLRLKAPRA